jgi:hypothetical protein
MEVVTQRENNQQFITLKRLYYLYLRGKQRVILCVKQILMRY